MTVEEICECAMVDGKFMITMDNKHYCTKEREQTDCSKRNKEYFIIVYDTEIKLYHKCNRENE